MNPSTAQARVLVDELVRNGVQHVVVSPGSRNAPLSFAAHQAEQEGRLRLHVRIDERGAGFLALGLAAVRHTPVAIVCTSGTAAANLHPAVTEAWHSGVPLIVCTADRPPELRAAGANQTIDQHGLYGTAVRFFDEWAVAENRPGQNAYWRTQVCRAWQASYGEGLFGGPVHLNLPFREPLVPGGDEQWCESLEGRPAEQPWMELSEQSRTPSVLTRLGARRGLVLAADGAIEASAWAQRHGWPVLSETGGVEVSDTEIATGMWLLNCPEFLARHRPEQVLCVGRPTVFRQVRALLSDSDAEVLLVHGDRVNWPAPAHDVREVAEGFGAPERAADPDWLMEWQRADKNASAALHTALDSEPWPSGLGIARDVVDSLPSEALLVLGSSNATRDVALAGRPRPDVLVHRNRGVAGIDGTVSTAIGAAISHHGPAYALVGDLTFLHDSNGLLLGSHERRPDLTIVVSHDDGGGIFSLLEQGSPEYESSFERVFGAPHGTDLGQLCAAHGVSHQIAHDRSELLSALRWRPGLRVVEVRSSRADLRESHERVRTAVAAAVAE